MTLVVFLAAVAASAIFVRSPFGATLCGTRDQPRRMNALGYHVWLIRFCAFMFSGLLTCVAGILFVYYNQFISPQTLALTASAEALLMVISGGAGTLLGPIVGAALVVIMKNVVSAYIERWNFMLGAIFVAIVIFMPEGLVPGAARLLRSAVAGDEPRQTGAGRGANAMSALAVTALSKSFGGLRVTTGVNLTVEPGERRLIIGPNGAGKTTLFNLITGELRPTPARSGCSTATSPACRAASARISAWRAPIRSSRCSRTTPSCATSRWRCSACRRCAGIPGRRSIAKAIWSSEARAALDACRSRPHRRPAAGADLLRRTAPRRDRHGAGAKSESAAARRAVRRPFDRRAPRRAQTSASPSRATSPS